jgi:hypothetical protein
MQDVSEDTSLRSDGASNRTDFYVYLFRNPLDNNNIFYIGKGTDDRAEQLKNRNDKTKAVIDAIRNEFSKTNRPIEDIIEILRENLDERTALGLESAAIDLIGIPPLTNINHGHGTKKWKRNPGFNRGRTSEIKEIIDPSEEADIKEPAILIRINQLYRYGMDADQLYDATRGVWVIGPRRERAVYAFSVFKGIVMEVYKITHPWYLAGTKSTTYKTRPNCNELWTSDPEKWEFEGEVAESEIRDKYLKKSVKRYLSNGNQNPIKYVNC